MHHNPAAARMVRQRRQSAPNATVIVDSVPPTSTSAVDVAALGVPTSTKALAVIVSLLAAIILLGAGYFFWRRKRNGKEEKAPSSHIIDFTSEKALTFDVDRKLDLHASAYRIEKPSPAFIPVVVASTPDADMSTGWVPQVLVPNRATDLASQSSTSSKKSKGSKKSFGSSRGWDKTLSKYAPSERSPPPSYMADSKAATLASQVPLPPSPPHKPTTPPTPPTPPAFKKTLKLNPFSRDIPSAKPMPTELPPSLPVLSPARSASFAAHQDASIAQMENGDEEMPPTRLMIVSSPFTPSLDDELTIAVGETLRILEEFQDGWALCQRIGRIDAPKGVVPRTCLTEREKIIPAGRRL